MLLDTTGQADQICQETFLASVLGRTRAINLAGETVGTGISSTEIHAACPKKDLVKIFLTMEFFPNYIWMFLHII